MYIRTSPTARDRAVMDFGVLPPFVEAAASRYAWAMRAISIATLVVLFVGCRSSEQLPHAEPDLAVTTPPTVANQFSRLGIPVRDGVPDLSKVTITLRRTGCLGNCPQYQVTLNGSGIRRYEGEALVIETGSVESFFMPTELLPILADLDAMDFMNLKHDCRYRYWEGSESITTVSIGEQRASFTSVVNGGFDTLEPASEGELHALYARITDAIDRVADDAQLVGTPEQRRSMIAVGRAHEVDAK